MAAVVDNDDNNGKLKRRRAPVQLLHLVRQLRTSRGARLLLGAAAAWVAYWWLWAGRQLGHVVTTPTHKYWVSPLSHSSSLPWGGVAVRASHDSPDALLSSPSTTTTTSTSTGTGSYGASIAICHPEWHGIRQATYGQNMPVIEIPAIKSWVHARSLENLLIALGIRRIVINGIPDGMVAWTQQMVQRHPDWEILYIYHGSVAQPFHIDEADSVNDMLELVQQGTVKRLGIVKEGLVKAFGSMVSSQSSRFQPTYEIWNFPNVPYRLRDPWLMQHPRRSWHIGVFGSAWIHKNTLVQIMALCQLDSVTIHVLKKPPFITYLKQCRAPIREHGNFLPHDKFAHLLRSMDMVLYVSLTECFPMMVVEAMSMGIPALTSATSPVYALDPVLERYLVVNQVDSPDHIARHVERVMANYDEISLRLWSVLPLVDFEAHRRLDAFIQGRHPVFGLDRTLPTLLPSTGLQLLKTENARRIAFLMVAVHKESELEYGISAVIGELLKHGHAVVLITDLSSSELRFWRDRYDISQRADLVVHQFDSRPTTADISQYGLDQHLVLYGGMQWSSGLARRVARAARDAHAKFSFHVLEVPDVGGLASELLLFDRHSRPDSSPTTEHEEPSYLPRSVLIYVRHYGPAQLIDQAYYFHPPELSPPLKRLYLQEQAAILAADAVLVGTDHWKKRLMRVYGLQNERVMMAPVPEEMVREAIGDGILPLLKQSRRGVVSFGEDADHDGDLSSGSMRTMTGSPGDDEKKTIVLVDLRGQLAMSALQIVQAAVSILSDYHHQWASIRFLILYDDEQLSARPSSTASPASPSSSSSAAAAARGESKPKPEEEMEMDVFDKAISGISWVSHWSLPSSSPRLPPHLERARLLIPRLLAHHFEFWNGRVTHDWAVETSPRILCAIYVSCVDSIGVSMAMWQQLGVDLVVAKGLVDGLALDLRHGLGDDEQRSSSSSGSSTDGRMGRIVEFEMSDPLDKVTTIRLNRKFDVFTDDGDNDESSFTATRGDDRSKEDDDDAGSQLLDKTAAAIRLRLVQWFKSFRAHNSNPTSSSPLHKKKRPTHDTVKVYTSYGSGDAAVLRQQDQLQESRVETSDRLKYLVRVLELERT